MQSFRIFVLALLVVGSAWFEFGQPLTAKSLMRRAEDAFDRRPPRRILMLGNSRTFFHDMPDMVRAMADSSGDPQKFEITLDAPPGASFEILWNDEATQKLLREQWDDVVLQPESRAQGTDELKRSFQTYGTRLIAASHVTSGTPRLVVNWNYDAKLFDGDDSDGRGRAAHYADTQANTAALANRTGAGLVNIGRLWAEVAADDPAITLTEDGNHPTLAGSYLFALLLYGDLSGRDISKISYVPSGLDNRTADTLKQLASDYRMVAS
jgi:hypothetical protein